MTKLGSDLQCPPLQPAVSIQVLFSFKWQPFLRGRVERSLASETYLLSLAALLAIPAEICFEIHVLGKGELAQSTLAGLSQLLKNNDLQHFLISPSPHFEGLSPVH